MIELLNIDCNEYMRSVPDNHFDLAVVDPPYGGSMMKKNKNQCHNTCDTSYRNKSIPGAEYFSELKRVSKDSIIFGCQYMMKYLDPAGSFIIWDKGANPDLHNMSACDVAWYSKREQIRKGYFHWCGAVKCESEKTIHIHQKPVKLYRWILNNYAAADYKILDTHMGSGSSAIAAHYAGLDFVGCELDDINFKNAQERIARQTTQIQMFK